MPSPRQQAIMLIRNGKNKQVPSGSESMASMRELFSTYLGGLAGSRKSIVHTRSISSKMEEKASKESDSLVVPMKPVMTVEGRGGHTNRSQRAYLSWKRYKMLLENHPITEPRIYVNIWQAL